MGSVHFGGHLECRLTPFWKIPAQQPVKGRYEKPI